MTAQYLRVATALLTATLACTKNDAVGTPLEVPTGENSPRTQRTFSALQLPSEGEFPPLEGATEWLNSQPLTAAGLRGHVVLIQFWTYSCINWLRTLPYLRAWAEKYGPSV